MSLKPNRDVMQAALKVAEANQTPFGAALAMGEEVFATDFNLIKEKDNPAAHAEMKVIRQLKEQTRKSDLSGFIIYSTCEPSPYCMNGIISSGIKTIVYGCGTGIVEKYLNRTDLQTYSTGSENPNEIEVIKGFMRKECEDLLRKFS